jgi:hypothetical protein
VSPRRLHSGRWSASTFASPIRSRVTFSHLSCLVGMPNNIIRPFLIAFVNLSLLGIASGQTADDAPAATPATTPTPSNDQSRLTGKWIVHFTVENQTVSGKMSLQLEGEKVTGSIETAHTGPGTFQDGKWIDGKLAATLVFEKHESIVFTGEFKGDNNQKLEGEFRTEGRTGKWQADRASDKEPIAGATP